MNEDGMAGLVFAGRQAGERHPEAQGKSEFLNDDEEVIGTRLSTRFGLKVSTTVTGEPGLKYCRTDDKHRYFISQLLVGTIKPLPARDF